MARKPPFWHCQSRVNMVEYTYSPLIYLMASNATAFLGASTLLGRYWTKRRHFDYLIDKENFHRTFGRSFRTLVCLDPAVSEGAVRMRQEEEEDIRQTAELMIHLADIKPELTIFVTTCDMLPDDADENTPALKSSDDPFVQRRIDLHREVNRQYGRVLNVHLPELVSAENRGFSALMDALIEPPSGKKKLPFAPMEAHQLYFAQRILGDVERCIPLGIPSIIPAAPPLTTTEIVQALAPSLLDRLPAYSPEQPRGSLRKSIHSFQWLDPKDGYLVTKEDQLELLLFFFQAACK